MKLSFIKYPVRCILDFLFPPSCLVCGEYLDKGIYVCSGCLDKLELHKNDSRNSISVFAYNDSIRSLIHELKYNDRPEIGYILGKEMGKRLKEYLSSGKTLLIPVPLHKRRLRKRGYNQSEKICEGLSFELSLPMKKDLIFRKKNNVSQTKLNAALRAENVKGIFEFGGSDIDRDTQIILVDDIITTGSTAKEAAGVIKRNGFSEFFAISVATSTK